MAKKKEKRLENGIYIDKKEFCSILSDLLNNKKKYDSNFKQAPFCEAIGIDITTLTKYLNPCLPNMPEIDTLMRMCELLGCDADYLLGRISFTTHTAQQVYKAIGLNEASFNYLKSLKNNYNPADDEIKLSTLNQILGTEEFDKILFHLAYARNDTTNLLITYSPYDIIGDLSVEQKIEIDSARRHHEDFVNSSEYLATKQLGKLFDKIVEIPLEDTLMICYYADRYYSLFGERFPSEQFPSDEDAVIKIKQCLLTNTPLSEKKG